MLPVKMNYLDRNITRFGAYNLPHIQTTIASNCIYDNLLFVLLCIVFCLNFYANVVKTNP